MTNGGQTGNDNQRKFSRFASDVPIEISLGEVVSHGREYLHNIGFGGLCFTSRICLPPGTVMDIGIPLANPEFRTRGTVVWCQDRGAFYDVGVEFEHPGQVVHSRLVEGICHIENYKRIVREQEGRLLTGEQAAMEWLKKVAPLAPARRTPDSKAGD